MYRVLIVKSKRRAHTVQVSYELHRLGLSRCSVERVAKIEDSESLTLDLEVPGTQSYIASLDADPTGRYLYYIPGAHGGSDQDGTPVVQFDVQTKQKKVLAFLHPFYQEKYGAALRGTYSLAVDPKGDKLYISWNVSRGTRAWDCCALTVVHIPESERLP